MSDRPVLIGMLLEDPCLTLEQLCSACAVSPEWVASHVTEGRLHTSGQEPSQWRFSSHDLWRVRQIRRFEVAFEAEPELAALVTDLIEELVDLRAQLRRIGSG
jgi:chaperone modulatory protein CbpM